MHRKDINERSPLRVLDKSIHGGLGRGNIGVVIARTGVGFDAVDLDACNEHGIVVTTTPGVNHHAVAEHTVGLMLALNRKIHRAFNRVREGNFAIDGLLGFDVHGRTVGIVGTGRIGAIVAAPNGR